MGDTEQSGLSIIKRSWLPWLALAWAGSLWWTMGWPRVGIWSAGILAVLISSLAWRWLPTNPRWLSPVSLAWFSWAVLAVLGVLSSQAWQVVIVVVSAAFLGWQLAHDQSQSHDRNTTRLTHVLTALSLFFSWLVLLSFGVGVVWLLPWWWLPIIAGGLTSMAASQIWSAAGIDWQKYYRSLPLVGIAGAGLMLATWWLPTLVYVGSIIAVTAVMLWLLTLRHVWLGSWETGRGRRYLIVGISVIGLLLITARWR